MLLLFGAPTTASAQQCSTSTGLMQLFKSPPQDPPLNKKPCWKAIVTIPALKLTSSARDNAVVDAFVLTSVGGGFALTVLET